MNAVLFLLILATHQVFSMGLNRDLESWELFKAKYRRNFASAAEEVKRKEIFYDNIEFIRKNNEKFENGLVNFTMGVNSFTDMTTQEFLATMTGLRVPEGFRPSITQNLTQPDIRDIPSRVDWRERGAVTEVKNQGPCGSCWAFSTTGSLEGQYFLRKGWMVSLSEQNLVDCDFHDGGCNGGWMGQAFQYIYETHGIDTEQSYPYSATKGSCRFNPRTVGGTVTGAVSLPSGHEDHLKFTVANVGPVSVCIDATQNFQHYRDGVFDDNTCTTTINHAVLAVGYGTDQRGGDYWLVKNSWGTSWGMQGYIKMSRNKGNQCGIASWGIYPTI